MIRAAWSKTHTYNRTRHLGRCAVHALLGMALLFGCSACAALVIGAAGGTAGAVYVLGKLQEEVNHLVPTVHQATVEALKDLDLPIRENRGDKLTAHLESEFADDKHVWIDLDAIGDSRTKLTIRVGIIGDEVRSRRILEAIKKHLPESRTG